VCVCAFVCVCVCLCVCVYVLIYIYVCYVLLQDPLKNAEISFETPRTPFNTSF